jgi:hypothetical protein
MKVWGPAGAAAKSFSDAHKKKLTVQPPELSWEEEYKAWLQRIGASEEKLASASLAQQCFKAGFEIGSKSIAGIMPNRAEIEWALSDDTGLSSLTIWSVMTGMPVPGRKYVKAHPHDADDFGRCFRLLERFPHWRERMPEVAEKYKGYWTDLVEVWIECEEIYIHYKKIFCTQFLRTLRENYSQGHRPPKEVLVRFIEKEKIKL